MKDEDPHSIQVHEGTSPLFKLEVRHDGVEELLDEGVERDGEGARIAWRTKRVTGWSVMHVRLVHREKRSERVFVLAPSEGERVALGEFSVEGGFEIVEKENNTNRAKTMWHEVK
jgi:hypothetical protein